MTNDFCIPEFQKFCEDIKNIFDISKENANGHLANYIPELNEVDPNLWGVSICTVDGQW